MAKNNFVAEVTLMETIWNKKTQKQELGNF